VHHSDGVLTGYDAEDIAEAAGWASDPQVFTGALTDCGGHSGTRRLAGFLDVLDGVFVLHQWEEHQPWVAGSEARRRKARELAETRWRKARGEQPDLFEGDDGEMRDACDTHAARNAARNAERNAPFLSSPNQDPPVSLTGDIPPSGGSAGVFERFWAVYPRREGKKPALEVWRRKKLDGRVDELIADVRERQARHRPWREGVIPHAKTYLRQERWTDEIDTAAPRGGGAPAPPSDPRGRYAHLTEGAP